ncbi:MAG: phosphoglycerate dehydrogenase [Nitrososphaeria archaeon]
MNLRRPIVLNFVSGGPSRYFSEEFFKKYEIRSSPFKAAAGVKELIPIIRDVDATIAGIEPYTKEVYDVAVRLKIVARYGVGYDNVDVAEATRHGVFVTTLPGINAETVAEHTLALIFAAARDLLNVARETKPSTWRNIAQSYYSEKTPFELSGKTLGILGLGAIGSTVAKLCAPLNMRILAFDPYINAEKAKAVGVELTSLETLLRESDILTIHAPLTDRTRHIIGEKELKMMKKTALLVNASRGALIDENALYRALKERWLSGAALDVLEKEPPETDNPLFTLDNVIITPHVAGASVENFMRCDAMIEQQIAEALAGKVPKFALNPEAANFRKR